MKESCATCKFGLDRGAYVTCRRKPPANGYDASSRNSYDSRPVMAPGDWCGKYKQSAAARKEYERTTCLQEIFVGLSHFGSCCRPKGHAGECGFSND